MPQTKVEKIIFGVLMSLYHGISYFFATWIQTIAMNIPMALVWQLAVCGPLVRFINRKIVVPTELKLQAN